jgi:hypothetical protein
MCELAPESVIHSVESIAVVDKAASKTAAFFIFVLGLIFLLSFHLFCFVLLISLSALVRFLVAHKICGNKLFIYLPVILRVTLLFAMLAFSLYQQ